MLQSPLMNFIERTYNNMSEYINKEFANEDSPVVSSSWKNKTNEDREKTISKVLADNNQNEIFEIVRADQNGQIILRTEKTITASERGVMLLDLEYLIKESVDNGITLWLEPVGDKSKLRNLRGIKINDEG